MPKQTEIIQAIILKADRHKEFDLRLVILTTDTIKTTYATGALRPTAKLRGALQLFNECEFQIIGTRITNAHITQNNTGVSKEIHRFYSASSISNTLTQILKNEQPTEQIYNLTFESMKLLSTTDISCYKIFVAFYTKLLSQLGYGVEQFEHSDKIDEFLGTDINDIDQIELTLTTAKKCIEAIKRAYIECLDIKVEFSKVF